MPEKFRHQYSVTVCPDCGNDLAAESGVTIESFRDGIGTGMVASKLDADGVLIDVFDLIADGLHSDTECGKCGLSLADLELERIDP